MWRSFFETLLPDADNLLPSPVQRVAEARVRGWWAGFGWQIVLGEAVICAAAAAQGVPHGWVYVALAGAFAGVYAIGLIRRWPITVWLIAFGLALLLHGVAVAGVGAAAGVAFIVPYMIAGMLLTGRARMRVQLACLLAFWASLGIGILPASRRLDPPTTLVISYDILLAVLTFQFLRFLSALAVEINAAHVMAEMRGQSQRVLARVSHELRTPLNSVLGFAKLMRRAPLDERHAEYLHQIVTEGEHLNRLVSDLLDSAHLATGKLTLHRAPCHLPDLIAAAADEQRHALPADVTLTLDLPPDLPLIEADPLRLRQAVGNLIANAVKYTERGTVAITAWAAGESLNIAVRDTGIGIPEDQQARVFVPFVQLDAHRIGVGLGLDIALHIVRLHGGDIALVSQPRVGSTFTITVPLRTTPESAIVRRESGP